MRNVKLALRMLFKSPLVTVVAILSLALGIGANAAIFSLFDQMILSPLPVRAPERLVNLNAPGPKYGSTTCNQTGDCDYVLSYPMYRDLERAAGPAGTLAAHRYFSANVAVPGGETMNAEGVLVSGSYFEVLGLQPAAGRLLGRGDDEIIGAHPVVVLSHGFWRTRMGSDPDVMGRTLVVNGTTLDIVGVAPETFHGATLGSRPVVYVPLVMRAQMSPGWNAFENRSNYWIYAFGRLAPGTSVEQAHAALNGVYRPILNEVEAPLQEGMDPQTLERFRARELLLEDGRRGQSSVHGEARTPLIMMFATAGIVLLIAVANIANLLLARGANRGLEMAVRLSLGARRAQVIGQLLTEAVLLALMGGAASLVVAHWTLAGIASLLPPEASESLAFSLQWSVVGFAAGLSVLTGLVFGLFPALHSTRSELVSSIRANAGNLTVTRGAVRFRTTLVTAQIALSMALLIAAGLFLKSLVNVTRVDLGLTADGIVTFQIAPELNGMAAEPRFRLFQEVQDQLAALPGVTAVTAAMVPVLAGSSWGTSVRVEGFESGPGIDSGARYNHVGAGYFATFGMPLLAGREFTRADDAVGPPVAVVNEAFVEKFGLGRDAVGSFMSDGGHDELDIQIVGVVRNAAYNNVKDEVPPLFFRPWLQNQEVGALAFYMSSPLPAGQVIRSAREVMRGIDSNLPLEDMKTMRQQIRENVAIDRIISILSACFAVLATLLAAVGLYGVLAYTVATRSREIGVRMALGASAGAVRRMVLGQVLRMLVVGGLVGIVGAVFLGRAASAILFGMEGTDPLVFAVSASVLAAFALAAGLVPAVRASRTAPSQALRYE